MPRAEPSLGIRAFVLISLNMIKYITFILLLLHNKTREKVYASVLYHLFYLELKSDPIIVLLGVKV